MKIGFIGLGIMGGAMCANIVKKHDDTVFCYDIDEAKVKELEKLGASACKDSRELARNSDIIITMVPKSEHVKAVYEGILSELDENKICIDMSTIDPEVSVEVSKLAAERGTAFADAPVVKSRPAAVAGKLGIYMGGDEALFEKIKPVLLYMGENVVRMGDNGKGLVMKILHNALVSQIQNGVNETVTLALANGIGVQEFARAISYGGGQNFYLDSKKDVIEKSDFTTAFSVENMHKDVHLCRSLAEKSGVCIPGEENVIRVYDEALKRGYGREDFSATIKVVKGE